MDVRVFARALRKRWWIVALFAVLGLGLGALNNANTANVYSTSLSLYVSVTPGTQANPGILSDDQSAQRRANSYEFLAKSERLASMVLASDSLITGLSRQQVMGEISATAEPNTVLINVSVTDTNGPRSLRIGRAIAKNFPILVRSLDDRGKSGTSAIELNVVSSPTFHPTPVSPHRRLTLAIGLLGGLLLGLLLAVLRELLDRTVRNAEDLRELTGRPRLGVITASSAMKNSPLITGDLARSIPAEEYRQLRTNLLFTHVDSPPKVIVVTSATAGEGKSTTAANLALIMVETGADVLLIEGDLRRPRLSQYFGLENAAGLTNVLAGQVELEDVLQPWGEHLTVLSSGSIPANPSELLGSRATETLVNKLRGRFSMIIIDTPPLLPVTDAAVAAAHADGVVVVVRYGKTTQAQITAALRTLDSVGAVTLGCVLNRQPARQSDTRRGYSAVRYYDDPKKAGSTKPRPTSSRTATSVENRPAPWELDDDRSADTTEPGSKKRDSQSAPSRSDSEQRNDSTERGGEVPTIELSDELLAERSLPTGESRD